MRNMEKSSRRRWHPSYVFLGVINSFNYKIRVWCLTVLSKHKPWGTLVTDFAKRLGSLGLACGSVGLPYMVVGCGGISLNWGGPGTNCLTSLRMLWVFSLPIKVVLTDRAGEEEVKCCVQCGFHGTPQAPIFAWQEDHPGL